MSQKTPKSKLPEQKSALDVAVNQLVRASVGGSVPPTLPDEDLDKYIADLVLKEASVKNKMYNKEGIRAYLPHTGTSQPCNLPKTNKRFLINVVKNVDYHNQALLRKIEEEAAARRIALRRKVSSRQRDRNSRTRKLSSRRLSRRRRYYSRSPSYDNRKSSSTREKSSRRSVSPEERVNLSTDSKNKPTSETNVVRKKGRGEVSNGSKMDKYFRKDYDPMFDVEPFIGEPGWYNFDRFEQMFAEKSEKSEKSSSKSKKKRRRDSDDETSDSNEDVETSIKKRRKNDNNHKTIVSVREWDKPKLVFGNWDLDKTI
ncbi:4122_t:CDS:2 [Funneliformis mosseae]|uniref:4122_t:CDS:1 n=1 Tax=Funneliformis mosseae TaxID=27381 RepID=A0A9N9API6_FUNMO|nr:4122_t:CDS:2 [Funneliformis mosseae]